MKNLNIGLDNSVKEKVSDILKHILADTYVLYYKTQVSHWNIEDPRFHSLHEMFEEQYEQLQDATDEIAERMRTLGAKAPLGLQTLLEATKLKEYEKDLDANNMIKSLLEDHEHLIIELRQGIKTCADLGDDGNADFLTARLEEHEKTAWMLRSSL
ncbi:DNA starvation/stationary phase protection protein [Candidatus Peregrinibacteria bacterium]|nr:DNA starvation/stationary phase protection protein [Candidatus Peregrinibacteria bacterium]